MRYLLFGIIVLVFASCLKNLDPPITTEYYVSFINPEEWLSDNPISFSNPEVGQTSYYAFFRGKQYKNDDVFDDYQYTGAVISLEIIDEDENGYLIKEVLEKDSLETITGYNENLSYQYYMKIDENLQDVELFDPENELTINSLFFGNSPISLPLAAFTNLETEINGWKTTIPYCECDQTAFVTNYTQFTTTFDYLNVYIKNSLLVAGSIGHTAVYASEHGFVRFIQYTPAGIDGTGWDFLGKK